MSLSYQIKIRTQETNLGNFVTDIMLASVNADCAIINSGSFRSDTLHPIGEFKVRDLKKILPYLDESVVLCVKGTTKLNDCSYKKFNPSIFKKIIRVTTYKST